MTKKSTRKANPGRSPFGNPGTTLKALLKRGFPKRPDPAEAHGFHVDVDYLQARQPRDTVSVWCVQPKRSACGHVFCFFVYPLKVRNWPYKPNLSFPVWF